MYEYRGQVVNVVDGDTIDIKVDLGFKIYNMVRVRLKRIDTPEIFRPKTPEELVRGRKAKHFVEERLLNKMIILATYKDKTGKYGRYIADIVYRGEHGEALFISEELKKAGLEKKYLTE